jgi:hypothetical protein
MAADAHTSTMKSGWPWCGSVLGVGVLGACLVGCTQQSPPPPTPGTAVGAVSGTLYGCFGYFGPEGLDRPGDGDSKGAHQGLHYHPRAPDLRPWSGQRLTVGRKRLPARASGWRVRDDGARSCAPAGVRSHGHCPGGQDCHSELDLGVLAPNRSLRVRQNSARADVSIMGGVIEPGGERGRPQVCFGSDSAAVGSTGADPQGLGA